MSSEIDWGELVDLYVDNECSEEERRLLEAQAAKDENVREELDFALRIRAGLSALKAELPNEFGERLQQALENASAPNAPCVRNGSERASGAAARRKLGIVAGLAASIAVVLGIGAWNGQRDAGKGVVENGQTAQNETPNLGEGLETKQDEPFIRIPAAIGDMTESVSKSDLESSFWVVVKLDDPALTKKRSSEFQRLCGKLDIRFTKSGNDAVYLLKEVSVEQWKQAGEALAGFGGNDLSDALEVWRDGGTDETRDVRVIFRDEEDKGLMGEGASAEE